MCECKGLVVQSMNYTDEYSVLGSNNWLQYINYLQEIPKSMFNLLPLPA